MTGSYNAKMRIDLQRANGDRAFAEYVKFSVAGEDKGYALEGEQSMIDLNYINSNYNRTPRWEPCLVR